MPRRSAVDFILDLEIHGIKLGLEKIRLLLRELGSPERAFPCVLVAGTNGKGSVTAMLAEALTRAGYRCGRYTSPHLVDLRERICLNDRPIPPPALERGAAVVRRALRRLLRDGRLDSHCTFFEATTALALDYFARRRVDVAILEVGMGGRFDATNAVEPVLSIITNVELDHERWLGSTRAAIAREKAGIARPGRPLVVGPTCDESLAVIRAVAARLGSTRIEVESAIAAERLASGSDGARDPKVGRPEAEGAGANGGTTPAGSGAAPAFGEAATLITPRRTYGPLRLGLAGLHQIDNARTAVAALEVLEKIGLRVGAEPIEAGLREVRWPGRLDHLPGRPLVILDGAHNPAGARALASYLHDHAAGDLTLVFGAMQDKSIARMAEPLFPLARGVVLTRAPYKRAAEPAALRAALAPLCADVRVIEEPARALEAALGLTSPTGTVCVCGSLYLIGSVLTHPELRARRRAAAAARLAARPPVPALAASAPRPCTRAGARPRLGASLPPPPSI
jgi:dihydrofolate synthase/folylpolyglutamate synthase